MMFTDIPGLADVKRILVNAVNSNHSAHAIMFLGKPGSANLSMALSFATYLNCENRNESDACGVCLSCVKMNKFIHPDFHFLMPTPGKVDGDAEQAKLLIEWRSFLLSHPYADHASWAQTLGAENKQLGIKIDESRRLVSQLTLKAFEGPYKIALIWLPEFMNVAAANMLLKTLEEPSEKTIFLLVCSDIEKVIVTIQSRCQLVYIKDCEDSEILDFLIQRGVEKSIAEKATYLADGNLQLALEYSQQGTPAESYVLQFRDWMRLCFNYQNNLKEIISFSDKMQSAGREEQKSFLINSIKFFNEALLKKFTDNQLVRLKEDELDFINNFSKVINESNIDSIINEFGKAHYHIERNAIGSLTFMDLSLKLGQLLRVS